MTAYENITAVLDRIEKVSIKGLNYAIELEDIEQLQEAQQQVKNCDLADVVGRSEQYHCELYDFGRQKKRCEKQCDSCKWMEEKQSERDFVKDFHTWRLPNEKPQEQRVDYQKMFSNCSQPDQLREVAQEVIELSKQEFTDQEMSYKIEKLEKALTKNKEDERNYI